MFLVVEKGCIGSEWVNVHGQQVLQTFLVFIVFLLFWIFCIIKLRQRVTVYCIICGQQIYQKKNFPLVAWLYIFFQCFLNRICPVEKCGLAPLYLYCDSLTLIKEHGVFPFILFLQNRNWKVWLDFSCC